jgi:hypothetical protein
VGDITRSWDGMIQDTKLHCKEYMVCMRLDIVKGGGRVLQHIDALLLLMASTHDFWLIRKVGIIMYVGMIMALGGHGFLKPQNKAKPFIFLVTMDFRTSLEWIGYLANAGCPFVDLGLVFVVSCLVLKLGDKNCL